MFDDFVQSSSSQHTPQNHRRISNNHPGSPRANGQYSNGSRFNAQYDSINDGFEDEDHGVRGMQGDGGGTMLRLVHARSNSRARDWASSLPMRALLRIPIPSFSSAEFSMHSQRRSRS